MSRSIVFWTVFGAATSCVACQGGGAEADKTSAVQSEFVKARDDYRHQKQGDLELIDKGIASLETKDKAAMGQTKKDLDQMLSLVKVGRDKFKAELASIESATASTWDSTKARLDSEWAALKASADKATATAAALRRPIDMTCEEFVTLTDVEKPKIVYWVEGFDKNGKAIESTVDVEETDKLIPTLVAECTKSPTELLGKAVQMHGSAATKPVAAASRPEKMTCQEFVALGDVEKPKVVYWAEGFNRDGGVTDSFVDIAETDRLVPVLVKECKEEPKLTFWQKIKKYL